MVNKIFQARHSQIFVTCVVLSVLQEVASNVNALFDTLMYIISIVLYVGWLLLLGNRLRKISLTPQLNYPHFIFVGCTLAVVIITLRLLVLIKPDILKMFDDITVIVVLLIYLLTSLIILTSFVGKNLKAIEVGDDIDINDYFGDVFGLIFWPIGIWTFQPRINKLASRLAGG